MLSLINSNTWLTSNKCSIWATNYSASLLNFIMSTIINIGIQQLTTKFYWFCDLSNIVAFGHNEYWWALSTTVILLIKINQKIKVTSLAAAVVNIM